MSLFRREPLRDQVRTLLLEWLLQGELEPGSSISEPELARRLDISRTPLREALLKLEIEGLLRSEPGKGFSVRPLTPDTAENLYELTGILEVEALKDAGLPDAETIDQLEEYDQRRTFDADDHDPVDAIRYDQMWHELLVSRCTNAEMLETLRMLKNRLYRYEYIFADDFARLGTKGLDHHAAITTALREGDLDEALRMLREHWEMGARSRSGFLRETEALSAARSS